jgi:hypothetical protein
MRTRFLSGMSAFGFGVPDNDIRSDLRKRRHQPAEKNRSGGGAGELGDDEPSGVSRPDAGKRIESCAGQRHSGIGERGGTGKR